MTAAKAHRAMDTEMDSQFFHYTDLTISESARGGSRVQKIYPTLLIRFLKYTTSPNKKTWVGFSKPGNN